MVLRLLITVCFIFQTLVSFAQVDVKKLEKKYGEGEITFKKKIQISFVYDEDSRSYFAKVSHSYQKLNISEKRSNGLVQIPFNAFQELKLKKARYFKLDSAGSKTLVENVKVKYADEKDYFISGIFYADLKVKQFKCAVELPENYITHYSYDLIYKDLKFIHAFYLQDKNEIVKEVEISIKKDANIDLAFFEQNLGSKVKRTEDDNYIKFKAKSLNRIKSHRGSVNGNYYLPHIIISVKSTETPEKVTEILSSTKNQYDWYNSLVSELQPNREYLKQLSSAIIAGKTTDEQKIEAIYKWVQDNVQYVAFEDGIAGFKPSEAHQVAQLRYGDCKGMANLLVNLLRVEGFDASHAWIGTRSNNYSYDIPSLIVDNHMICALNYQQKRYFLDGTSKSATWVIPPPQLEGKEVLVARGASYAIDTIKVSSPIENSIRFNGEIDLTAKQPGIKLNVELRGHFIRDYQSNLNYTSMENRETVPFYFLRKYLDGIKVNQITNIKISEDKISYSILGEYLHAAKGKESITIFPFLDVLNFSSLAADEAPSYIDYPHNINVSLKVKNGKIANEELQALPASLNFGNSFAKYKVENNGTEYTLNQELHIDELHSPLVEYEKWNLFVNGINMLNNYPLTYQLNE